MDTGGLRTDGAKGNCAGGSGDSRDAATLRDVLRASERESFAGVFGYHDPRSHADGPRPYRRRGGLRWLLILVVLCSAGYALWRWQPDPCRGALERGKATLHELAEKTQEVTIDDGDHVVTGTPDEVREQVRARLLARAEDGRRRVHELDAQCRQLEKPIDYPFITKKSPPGKPNKSLGEYSPAAYDRIMETRACEQRARREELSRVREQYRAELKRVKAIRADAHHAQTASMADLEELSAKY